MRTISGAILLLAAEQAFAHSQMVSFPNQVFASQVLYPASMILAGLGLLLLVWGILTDRLPNTGSSSS
ncbi:MAG: hypothetical protein ACF8PG_16215 [Maioricimonas sp. JB045]|uniref:hypothetical protein n=1 Tax=Maioricimonas sp. JC845 TaxID=3232138 RepID=UPI003459D916